MYIYLIEAKGTGKYKIGISKNPKERLEQLQTANGEKLEIICTFATRYKYLLEKTLHSHFKSKQTLGEWFGLTDKEVENFALTCGKFELNFQILKESNSYFQENEGRGYT